MEKNNVLEKLGRKNIKAEDAAKNAMEDSSLLPLIFEGVSSTNPRIRYGCAKILRIISEENPQELYPRIDFFIELLNSDKRVLKWTTIHVIANLARVDVNNRFDDAFDRYYRLLDAEYIVTVANVVSNSGKIAMAKPHLANKITRELLKVENLTLKSNFTQECKNIILGHAISALDMYFDQIEKKAEVISFVKRQQNDPRNATKAKAEKFLKKWLID